MGRVGLVVGSVPYVRKVARLKSTIATTYRPWATHSLAISWNASACLLRHGINTIQYNTISFIADDKNKDREVSADTTATETYCMMGIIKF